MNPSHRAHRLPVTLAGLAAAAVALPARQNLSHHGQPQTAPSKPPGIAG